ncbi:MAG: SPOR domain-containing protein [Terracidiphilus sp.]|jgi:cell division septation protein DedD
MDDDFNPDDLRPVPYEPDTELTLGWGTLSGVFLCLLALCGLCFWQGYSMGSHSAHVTPTTGQQSGPKTATPATGSAPKPSAGPQGVNRPRAAIDAQPSSDSVPSSNPTGFVGGSTVQAAVRPALPDTTPALMVQIAAVSHQEDADVLVAALRKRGYTVSMSRDPADGLIHVRIGPFASRSDANAARQKLLNDGYNASVQP